MHLLGVNNIRILHGQMSYPKKALTVIAVCFIGFMYKGDISVDDIRFINCAPPVPSKDSMGCLPDEVACTNGYCIKDSQVCDMQTDCMDMSDEMVRFYLSEGCIVEIAGILYYSLVQLSNG